MTQKKKALNIILLIILIPLALAWLYPIFMILMNSLKVESAITTSSAFELVNGSNFGGSINYLKAINSFGFMTSLFYSFFITVTSVVAIVILCSMCAWYISRVHSKFSSFLYYLFVFSMVVPFQMVMFTLSQTADMLKLNNPFNLWVSRISCIHVCRLREIDPSRDRRSRDDRWMYSTSNILQSRASDLKTDDGFGRDPRGDVGMERLLAANPRARYHKI